MAVWSIVKVSELEGAKRLDAEYYQPKYRIDFGKGSWVAIGDIVQICQYGISQAMTEEPVGYPIFRMDDIKNAFLVDDEVKYLQIPDSIFKRYKLELDDILFNRVNSEEFVGRTGIFKLAGDYVFASYLIRLRIKPNSLILPDYLNVVLNSAFGVKQIRKLSRRAVNQANVNAEELKGIKVALIPLSAQQEVKQLCDKSFDEFESSKYLYRQAEQMVLEEIGWDKLDLSQPKWWTIPLSRAQDVHRLDAEHFQPKYDKLIAHLKKTGRVKPLGEIAPFINHGPQPPYSDIQEIPVITQRHMGRYMLNFDSPEEFTTKAFWASKQKFQVRKQDVLFYSVGAYLGRTNLYLSDIPAMAGSYITIIRPNDEKCLPEYLAVYLNAVQGQMQSDKHSRASGQQYIYPPDIARFLVYLPSENFQQRVADLLWQSYQARQKAKALLDEAKTKVEALIEGR